ncbi:MAG: mycofactocin-associated electron transfer flavoprotein alpha subunit [Acidimicrobiales bacterium]
MIAVVPVRDGVLPVGSDEAVAEAGGSAIVVGSQAEVAAAQLRTATEVRTAELGAFAAGAWANALAPLLRELDVVVLPASPDGRDLAPRIAHSLGRPLLAGATAITPERVVVVRRGGLVAEEHVVDGPIVATLVPGVRGVDAATATAVVRTALALTLDSTIVDGEQLEVLPPDPATVDLSEAARIMSGGAGLGGPEPFALLERVALALGASYGASRVAADVGWAPQDRFIGTTGVMVNPSLYVAFGISGAVQHVTGLGDPDHIIAVNTDGSAPMMAMADLAIVTDASALLDALADRLEVQR